MSSVGIMQRARRLVFAFFSLALMVSAVSAQTPPAPPRDDLDVTMRVIVDPNAKVPDEIVHRISLPKPVQPASGTAPQSDNPDKADKADKADKSGKPSEPGAKGKDHAPEPQQQGREFGQQTAEEARQHAEDARKNKEHKPEPHGPPNPPPGNPPMGPPPRPGG